MKSPTTHLWFTQFRTYCGITKPLYVTDKLIETDCKNCKRLYEIYASKKLSVEVSEGVS